MGCSPRFRLSVHGFSISRISHFRTNKMFSFLVVIITLSLKLNTVSCASYKNVSSLSTNRDSSNEVQSANNNTYSRERSSVDLLMNTGYHTPIPHVNPHLNLPVTPLGFPLFFQNTNNQRLPTPTPRPFKKKSQVKEILTESQTPNNVTILDQPAKLKGTKKNTETKKKQNGNDTDMVESKTIGDEDQGSSRGCPACEGEGCDPMLETKFKFDIKPLLPIIIAFLLGAGISAAISAGVATAIVHKKLKGDKDEEEEGYSEGYSYSSAPSSEYGTPDHQYGEPIITGSYSSSSPTASAYNTNRISNRYGQGRRSQSYSFNQLSKWVWNALDKVGKLYDN